MRVEKHLKLQHIIKSFASFQTISILFLVVVMNWFKKGMLYYIDAKLFVKATKKRERNIGCYNFCIVYRLRRRKNKHQHKNQSIIIFNCNYIYEIKPLSDRIRLLYFLALVSLCLYSVIRLQWPLCWLLYIHNG